MTRHPYMEEFFLALEEWEQATAGFKTIKLCDLAFLLSYPIGGSSPRPNMPSAEYVRSFRERVVYLLDEQGFQEDFLMTSLVMAVKENLHASLEGHGNMIVTNEYMMEDAEKELGSSDFLLGKLQELKESTYAARLMWTLDAWERISAVRLGRAQRRRWLDESVSQTAKRLDDIWRGVPEKVREALSGVTLRDLYQHLGSRDWTKLTVEEVEEIKRRIKSEEG